jgi:putative Mg2+ transporter-C (MgtC) family protein
MWLAGAVGVAVALGYYLIALGVAVLAVMILAVLRAFAHRVVGRDAQNPAVKGPRGEADGD